MFDLFPLGEESVVVGPQLDEIQLQFFLFQFGLGGEPMKIGILFLERCGL
jgi:hypothetical protein